MDPNETPTPTPTPPSAPAEVAAPAAAEPTYTPPASQAELDRIVQNRLAREQAKYADYDEMKTRLAEIEDAGKSETQRAVEAARAEGAAEARGALEAQIISTTVRALATSAGFVDPADVVKFLDAAAITVGDDGPDTAAISAALDDLANTKPYLLAPSGVKVAPRETVRRGASPQSTGEKKSAGTASSALRAFSKTRRG